jgi:hypothetical protein
MDTVINHFLIHEGGFVPTQGEHVYLSHACDVIE